MPKLENLHVHFHAFSGKGDKEKQLGEEGKKIRGTNERPGTDHVTSRPMKGLEKNAHDGADR